MEEKIELEEWKEYFKELLGEEETERGKKLRRKEGTGKGRRDREFLKEEIMGY